MDVPKPTCWDDIRPAIIVEDGPDAQHFLQLDLKEDGKSQTIVRMYKESKIISEIYDTFKNDELSAYANADNLEMTIAGGGMIKHDSVAKEFNHYAGEFGPETSPLNAEWGKIMDPLASVEIIKKSYPMDGY